MQPDATTTDPVLDAWRFVRRSLAYLLILGLFCGIVQHLVMKQVRPHMGIAASMTLLKREWIRDGWVKFPEGKTGVIAMGDSRMLAALSPVDFDAAMSDTTRTYNLSLPASTSDTHRAVLRDIISSGEKPEWIILGLTPNTPARPDTASYRSIGIANPLELGPVIRSHPQWRKIVADWLLPIRRFQTDFVKWLNRLVFNQNHIEGRRAATQMLADQLRDDRGAFANSGVVKSTPGEPPPPNYLNISPDIDSASREVLELAAAHGIKVLLISAPVRPGELIRNPETAAIAATVLDGFPGIFMSPRYFDPLVLGEDNFTDWVHVNPVGAAAFSRAAATEFKDLRNSQSKDSIPASQPEP
ncbi:MAG: hypothetical protein ACOVMP_09555 [Chthoniobacterales bacterium]